MKMRLFPPILLFIIAASAANAQILSTRPDSEASNRERFISAARGYIGVPYVLGGTGRDGMDCSGLVYRAALDRPGVAVPRTVIALSGKADHIPNPAMEPGDLLFFNTTGQLSHVAIYLGGGNFIHAASDGPRTGVIISNLSEAYWKKAYRYAGRILLAEGLTEPDQSANGVLGDDTAGDTDTAPSVNEFSSAGGIGLRINYTGGMLWDILPGEYPIRGALLNAEISWMKGVQAYPGIGVGFAWDSRKESFSLPLTVSLSFDSGFRFFVGTQFHLTAQTGLDRTPQFPGIIGISWNSKPAEIFGQRIRFYQSAEYSRFPDERIDGFRFNTGLTITQDL